MVNTVSILISLDSLYRSLRTRTGATNCNGSVCFESTCLSVSDKSIAYSLYCILHAVFHKVVYAVFSSHLKQLYTTLLPHDLTVLEVLKYFQNVVSVNKNMIQIYIQNLHTVHNMHIVYC